MVDYNLALTTDSQVKQRMDLEEQLFSGGKTNKQQQTNPKEQKISLLLYPKLLTVFYLSLTEANSKMSVPYVLEYLPSFFFFFLHKIF